MSIKKRLMEFILVSSLLGLNIAPLYAYNYNDINNDFWAQNYISNLSNDGILTGYSDNTFRPNAPVTRAEFATMIIKALEKENTRVTHRYNFRDVSANHWGYQNIQRAQQLGLISGYPNGTFKPNDYITRTQVLAVFSKGVNSDNLSHVQANQILDQFSDSNQIQEWAKPAVAGAVMANLQINYPNQSFLTPNANATRAEVAGMLFNMRKYLSLNNSSNNQISTNNNMNNSNHNNDYNNYNNNNSNNNNNKEDNNNDNNNYYQGSNMPPVEDIIQLTAQGAASDITLQGSIATIQENSVFPAVISTPISSRIARIGDLVTLTTNKNLTTPNGSILIPSGSKINGEINTVEAARYANRAAQLSLKFTSIEMPNGNTYPLRASIATEDGMIVSGSLKSKVGKGLLKTAEGAAIGAGLGTALGAITGKTGKGAIYGTAFGGGLGILSSILLKGGEIELPSGEPVFIKLDQPLSVDLNTGNVVN